MQRKREDSGNELNNLRLSYLTVIVNAKILIQIHGTDVFTVDSP